MTFELNLRQLQQLTHIRSQDLQGRTLHLMPLWQNEIWQAWVPAADGNLHPLQIVDVGHSLYLCKEKPAQEDDLYFPVIDFIWQHLSYPSLIKFMVALEEDLHLLATCASKLEHFHQNRDRINKSLISSYVKSEIEYIMMLARSAFDLLQEVIAAFWNQHVKLLDQKSQELKLQNRLPASFRKVVLHADRCRSKNELISKYAIPEPLAMRYVQHADFFLSLRTSRNQIAHGTSGTGTIFDTEKGFCVDPTEKFYSSFQWGKEHYYNDNMVSLMPWLADIIFKTFNACHDIVLALPESIRVPDALAPECKVLLRDPANVSLLRLLEAAQGRRVWWSDNSETEITLGR